MDPRLDPPRRRAKASLREPEQVLTPGPVAVRLEPANSGEGEAEEQCSEDALDDDQHGIMTCDLAVAVLNVLRPSAPLAALIPRQGTDHIHLRYAAANISVGFNCIPMWVAYPSQGRHCSAGMAIPTLP